MLRTSESPAEFRAHIRTAMTFNVHIVGDPGRDSALVTVAGSLDTETAPILESRLAPLIAGRTRNILFDMARLEFLSSAGLRVFVKAQRDLGQKSGHLLLKNLQPHIARVFEIVRSVPGIDIFENEVEADRFLADLQQRLRGES